VIYDLTLPIRHGMPCYPGDPPVTVESAATLVADGYSVHSLRFGTHTGTHIDAPRHFVPDGKTVDDIAILTSACGPATVVDANHIAPGEDITPDSLGTLLSEINPGGRLLIATGWSRRHGDSDYFTGFPVVTETLAHWCVDTGIALLGVESPSLNPTCEAAVHGMLLEAGLVIVESLCGLEPLIGRTVDFYAAPLRLEGLDGSPVRAFAVAGSGRTEIPE